MRMWSPIWYPSAQVKYPRVLKFLLRVACYALFQDMMPPTGAPGRNSQSVFLFFALNLFLNGKTERRRTGESLSPVAMQGPAVWTEKTAWEVSLNHLQWTRLRCSATRAKNISAREGARGGGWGERWRERKRERGLFGFIATVPILTAVIPLQCGRRSVFSDWLTWENIDFYLIRPRGPPSGMEITRGLGRYLESTCVVRWTSNMAAFTFWGCTPCRWTPRCTAADTGQYSSAEIKLIFSFCLAFFNFVNCYVAGLEKNYR